MVIAGLTNNCLWFTYGILTDNWFIISPNIIFISLNTFTLVLCLVFDPKTHPLPEDFHVRGDDEDDAASAVVERTPKSPSCKGDSALPSPAFAAMHSPLECIQVSKIDPLGIEHDVQNDLDQWQRGAQDAEPEDKRVAIDKALENRRNSGSGLCLQLALDGLEQRRVEQEAVINDPLLVQRKYTASASFGVVVKGCPTRRPEVLALPAGTGRRTSRHHRIVAADLAGMGSKVSHSSAGDVLQGFANVTVSDVINNINVECVAVATQFASLTLYRIYQFTSSVSPVSSAHPAPQMVGSTAMRVVDVLSALTSLALICSPAIATYRIFRSKSVGVASIVPLATLLANSHMWALYGWIHPQLVPRVRGLPLRRRGRSALPRGLLALHAQAPPGSASAGRDACGLTRRHRLRCAWRNGPHGTDQRSGRVHRGRPLRRRRRVSLWRADGEALPRAQVQVGRLHQRAYGGRQLGQQLHVVHHAAAEGSRVSAEPSPKAPFSHKAEINSSSPAFEALRSPPETLVRLLDERYVVWAHFTIFTPGAAARAASSQDTDKQHDPRMTGDAGVMVVRVWVACSTLAMVYLPSLFVRRIYSEKNTGAAPIVPLLSLLVNSHVWMMYSYMYKTWFPSFPVFLTGDVVSLSYLLIYWRFSSERRRVGRTIGSVIAVLALPSVYVVIGGLGYTGQTRVEVGKTEGYVCDVAVVTLHLVMLKNLVNVFRTRSAASLNLRTLVVGTVNTFGWFTYGIVTSNWIISGPHVFVMVLHTAALVLYAALSPNTHLVASTGAAVTVEDPIVVSIELSSKVGVEEGSKAASNPEYHILSSPMAPLQQ
ncbi:hypothetical protein ON010_g1477 [Phytophthora cinnamomi]|nr:hypothetical protein ON010_g1477 [Phytophthora cinnamomi]